MLDQSGDAGHAFEVLGLHRVSKMTLAVIAGDGIVDPAAKRVGQQSDVSAERSAGVGSA